MLVTEMERLINDLERFATKDDLKQFEDRLVVAIAAVKSDTRIIAEHLPGLMQQVSEITEIVRRLDRQR